MKRILCALLALAVLITCGCVDVTLSDEFDEATVTEAAKATVALVNARDYEGVEALIREDLREGLSAEVLAGVLDELLDKNGGFQDYKSLSVIGQKSDEENCAVAVAACTYENGQLTYTLIFDTSMRLIGFYVK